MYINRLQLLYTVIENSLYEFYSVKFKINQCDFFFPFKKLTHFIVGVSTKHLPL